MMTGHQILINMLQSIRSGFNKAKLEEQSMKQLLGSKKDITLVTMNTHGRGVLGLTPQYKLEMIRQGDRVTHRKNLVWGLIRRGSFSFFRQHFAANKPDVVFIQDSIDTSDMLELIKKGTICFACIIGSFPNILFYNLFKIFFKPLQTMKHSSKMG